MWQTGNQKCEKTIFFRRGKKSKTSIKTNSKNFAANFIVKKIEKIWAPFSGINHIPFFQVEKFEKNFLEKMKRKFFFFKWMKKKKKNMKKKNV